MEKRRAERECGMGNCFARGPLRMLVAAMVWRRCCGLGQPALVSMRRQEEGAVKVRFCAVKSRAVLNRNCVAAMRGGEQREENDQSVTQTAVKGCRGELDSVGVSGRV